MQLRERLKSVVLPGPAPRRLRFGLAAGIRFYVDFAILTRTYLGLYEIELTRSLRRLLVPGTTAFDVGAEHGYDALLIARRTGARVASFEADPRAVRWMGRNFALNPDLAGLIVAVEGFVSSTGDGRLDAFAYGPDGFLPDFLKIDVEGSEHQALLGAARLLREHHPSLVVEVHSLELERRCGRLLVESGYHVRVISQRRLLPDRRPAAHNRWLVAEPVR